MSDEKGARTGLFSSTRQILYFVTFTLFGVLAAVEIGLVAQQLHDYGNQASNYPSLEYKNVIGLLLFAGIVSLLTVIGHAFAPPLFIAFLALALACFYGAAAGVIFQVSPFKSYTCGNPASSFPLQWQAFSSQCSRIVAIEAFAWTQWALSVIIFFGILADVLSIKVHSKPFYAGSA
ncbi:hypothetical protein MNV49_007620 [Pseudohyphozyma bogoriensis]|nr:hypothetical protein MNV49_007620 [Pseudohyphozyma bogoriensis]